MVESYWLRFIYFQHNRITRLVELLSLYEKSNQMQMGTASQQ